MLELETELAKARRPEASPEDAPAPAISPFLFWSQASAALAGGAGAAILAEASAPSPPRGRLTRLTQFRGPALSTASCAPRTGSPVALQGTVLSCGTLTVEYPSEIRAAVPLCSAGQHRTRVTSEIPQSHATAKSMARRCQDVRSQNGKASRLVKRHHSSCVTLTDSRRSCRLLAATCNDMSLATCIRQRRQARRPPQANPARSDRRKRHSVRCPDREIPRDPSLGRLPRGNEVPARACPGQLGEELSGLCRVVEYCGGGGGGGGSTAAGTGGNGQQHHEFLRLAWGGVHGVQARSQYQFTFGLETRQQTSETAVPTDRRLP